MLFSVKKTSGQYQKVCNILLVVSVIIITIRLFIFYKVWHNVIQSLVEIAAAAKEEMYPIITH